MYNNNEMVLIRETPGLTVRNPLSYLFIVYESSVKPQVKFSLKYDRWSTTPLLLFSTISRQMPQEHTSVHCFVHTLEMETPNSNT